jgi:tRNA nucleotidyltransferase (CCA-adding enzyme)
VPICYNTSYRRPSTRQFQHIGAPLDALESSLDGDNLSVLCCLRRRALTHSLAVYLVGGPVRDVLMGRPIRDLDFVVEGDGPEVVRGLAEELGGEVLVHARFGTATLVLGDNRIDVVTARRETYPQPAALPVVSPGGIADDLVRRDFSINALALLLGDSRPQVLDQHGGLGDICRGLVRTLHANSFVDDPTRMFRAVRYEQRLDFRIEEETLAHLLRATAQGYLASLTGDRLRHELERILQEERPELPLRRLGELGILAAIHPSLGDEPTAARLAAVAARESGEGSIPGQNAGPAPLIFISALAYSLSDGEGEAVIHRLNMPTTWAKVVRETIQIRGLEGKLTGASLPRSLLARLLESFGPEALLAVSRLTDSPMVARRLDYYLSELRFAVPALNGRDLLAMGVPEGPMVGQILRELRDAKLNGQVSTEKEERRLVQAVITRQEILSGHESLSGHG